MDDYDRYMQDLQDHIEIDRDTRLAVLDAAATIERHLMALGVIYLAGDNPSRRRVIEGQVGRWGGTEMAKNLIRSAIEEHDGVTVDDESNLRCIMDLLQLRHLIAHGRVEAPHANHPEIRDGQLGRTITKISRSGNLSVEWINLEDASDLATRALAAVTELGRRIARISEQSFN